MFNNTYQSPWEKEFDKELSSLRTWLKDYARQYPKAADNLDLDQGKSHDPQVELLLQSFAYLTGRIQYNLEIERNRIPQLMLEFLYPHLSAPIPSMTIVEMNVDPNGANFAKGFCLQKGRLLKTQAESVHKSREPIPIRFSTCYDTWLWPMIINQVQFFPVNTHDLLVHDKYIQSALKIDIQLKGNDNLKEWPIEHLRVFIQGDNKFSFGLYQALRLYTRGVLIETDTQSLRLESNALNFLGFEDEHAVLPYQDKEHKAYRYLHEYFVFPEKFLFFEIQLPENIDIEQQFSAYILFDRDISQSLEKPKPDSLKLNCIPAINLFPKTTVPFRLNHQQYDYRLMPDERYYRGMEIHTIEEVYGLNQGQQEPIYGFLDLPSDEVSQQRYWQGHRRMSEQKNLPGSEYYLSFHNPDFDPEIPTIERIYAKTQCTNRDIAEQIPVGSSLQLSGSGPVLDAMLIKRPTQRQDPPQDSGLLWQLVSHLNLNHLSLCEGKNSLVALKALLKLYSDISCPSHQTEIDALFDLNTRPVTERLSRDVWRGVGHGLLVNLTVDEHRFAQSQHGSLILFGEVLSHFFTLYGDINGFSKLKITSLQTQRDIKQWKPYTGSQSHL